MKSAPQQGPKVLHLCHAARRGGAATAAWRLHKSLEAADVDSRMAVRDASGAKGEPSVLVSNNIFKMAQSALVKHTELRLPRLRFSQLRKNGAVFSPSYWGASLEGATFSYNHDILHLHWINWGTISIEALRQSKRPIVWTFHDIWPMTGGCHYSGTCDRFQNACGRCTVINSERESDISQRLINRKLEAWRDLNINVVAPSKWMADQARASRLFRDKPIHTIPYGVDHTVFSDEKREQARSFFALTDKDKCVFFAAAGKSTREVRKGFNYLHQALRQLAANLPHSAPISLIVAGASEQELPSDIPFKTKALGTLRTESEMATFYAAADVFVAPSIEDNLPNTVLESLACGTPVVAFNIGGMPDMIDHKQNGYLAHARSAKSLAEGIQFILNSKNQSTLRANARSKVENTFTPGQQASAYLKLYRNLRQPPVT